jgi:hypothetical protein
VAGSGSLDSTSQTPDEDGEVTFEYTAPTGTTDTQEVRFSYVGIDGDYDATTPQNVSVELNVDEASSGTGPTGNLTYNGDAEAYDGPDGPAAPGGVNFSVTNDFTQRVTITGITVVPETDDPDLLSDEATPNGQPTRAEVYIAADREDGYVDIDGGTALPAEIDSDIQGFERGGNAVLSEGSVADVYLYEFYNTTRDENLDMGGVPLNITIDYRLQSQGLSGQRTFEITPVATSGGNQPPSAGFTYSPASPTTSDDITFDASDSTDSDGDTLSYEWDFGDGTTGSGETVDYSYSSSGSYPVELTVTDGNGGSDTTSDSVTVGSGSSGGSAPSIDSFVATSSGNSRKISVDASFSDPDNDLNELEIRVIDDSDGSQAYQVTESLDPAGDSIDRDLNGGSKFDTGDYTVELTVLDNAGNDVVATRDVSSTSGGPP